MVLVGGGWGGGLPSATRRDDVSSEDFGGPWLDWLTLCSKLPSPLVSEVISPLQEHRLYF